MNQCCGKSRCRTGYWCMSLRRTNWGRTSQSRTSRVPRGMSRSGRNQTRTSWSRTSWSRTNPRSRPGHGPVEPHGAPAAGPPGSRTSPHPRPAEWAGSRDAVRTEGQSPGSRSARRTPARRGRTSDLEEFRFLVLEDLVNDGHEAVSQVIKFLLRAPTLVLAHLAVLDQPVQLLFCLAPHVANRDLRLLALVPRPLDHLSAPFLGHGRAGPTPVVAVGGGVCPEG